MASVIDKFLQDVKEKNLNCCCLKVTEHGKTTAQHFWMEDQARNIYSATKSITSLAVGFAVSEGLLSTDEYIVDCFHGELPDTVSDELKEMRVEHLLTMTLGFDKQYLMGMQREELFKTTPDWVRYSLSRPFAHHPGTTFLYTGIGPYLAGVLVARRSGMDVIDYLMPRLFEPLGIARPQCERCPQGYFFGAGGMFMSCEDLSRVGQMILDRGMYEGKRIIAESWIERMSTMFAHQDVPDTSLLPEGEANFHIHLIQAEDDEELGNHYGYFFWIIDNKRLFLARGKYGQFCVIDRAHDAVITITADEHTDPHMILRLIRRDIISAFE